MIKPSSISITKFIPSIYLTTMINEGTSICSELTLSSSVNNLPQGQPCQELRFKTSNMFQYSSRFIFTSFKSFLVQFIIEPYNNLVNTYHPNYLQLEFRSQIYNFIQKRDARLACDVGHDLRTNILQNRNSKMMKTRVTLNQGRKKICQIDNLQRRFLIQSSLLMLGSHTRTKKVIK